MAASPMPRLTPEEYLAIERAAEFKSEYYDGQMFAMAGGSLPHSILPTQLAAALVNDLRGRGGRVANSDLKVRVSPKGPFVYPDLTVFCGEPQLADDYRDVLLNPRVVFEVLSKSSEAYDRGMKFEFCREIESLQEYVLISQSKPLIEVYLREPNSKWLLSSYSGLDAVCPLGSIDCSIKLADGYEGVKPGDQFGD
jgi:Uma2 family endonuclease